MGRGAEEAGGGLVTTLTGRQLDLDSAVQPTSMAAHRERVTSGRAATNQARILAAITASGESGMTLDEVVVQTGMLIQSASGDITALKNRGSIKRNGTTRATRTGHAASVWVATKVEGASA